MDDQFLSRLQAQNIVEALKCRQSTDGKNASLSRADACGDVGDVLGPNSHVFGIERAVGAVDRVAHFEAVYAGPNRGDSARAIRPEDHWKVRICRVARTVFRLPDAHAGG